jgi:TFIIF-interacting CTD phosphatase-like protein
MNKTKLNIILDLDQTIISAESAEEYDKAKNKTKEKKFIFHNMDNYYTIFERPGLQIFLDYLFKNFNVSIWTAASKDYALFIIDNIILQNKKERQLDWVFFSYHCDLSRKLMIMMKFLKLKKIIVLLQYLLNLKIKIAIKIIILKN